MNEFVPGVTGNLSVTAARERQIAYVLLRAFVGLDFCGHGYARLFTGSFLPGFAQSLQTSMEHAPLDPGLVLAVGYVIPVVEFIVGFLLLFGFWTRWAMYGAYVLLFVLMFGVTMKQDWNAAAEQLLYALALFVLLWLREDWDRSWISVWRKA